MEALAGGWQFNTTRPDPERVAVQRELPQCQPGPRHRPEPARPDRGPGGPKTQDEWFNATPIGSPGSAFGRPAAGTFGTLGRHELRGPGFWSRRCLVLQEHLDGSDASVGGPHRVGEHPQPRQPRPTRTARSECPGTTTRMPAASPRRRVTAAGTSSSGSASSSEGTGFRQGQRAVLSYERAGSNALLGTQELKYYVGSNTRGRTFLFEIDGFLYQSPINYYAAKNGSGTCRRDTRSSAKWSSIIPWTPLASSVTQAVVQPTDEGHHQPLRRRCPSCRTALAASDVTAQGAITSIVRGPMVNPAKLTGEQQDSICMQCHLEGEARIARAARSQADYTPGEVLSDYLAIFVREDNQQQRRAVSHVESLAISRCRRAGGAALSCTTCHDPHSQPSARDKTASYRAKCIACHTPMAARHFPRQQDCTACHMPRTESADIRHTVVTDHRIVREPQAGQRLRAGERPPRAIRQLPA